MTKGPANPVTAAELAAALPALLAAPRDAGGVRLLCTRPEPNARHFPDRLIFSRTDGVIGDFEMSRPWLRRPDGSPDPAASTSMLSSTAFRHLKKRAAKVPDGIEHKLHEGAVMVAHALHLLRMTETWPCKAGVIRYAFQAWRRFRAGLKSPLRANWHIGPSCFSSRSAEDAGDFLNKFNIQPFAIWSINST